VISGICRFTRKARLPIGGRALISRTDSLPDFDQRPPIGGCVPWANMQEKRRCVRGAVLGLFHAPRELGQAGVAAKRLRFHEEKGVSSKGKGKKGDFST
jgi:hypothetical protein